MITDKAWGWTADFEAWLSFAVGPDEIKPGGEEGGFSDDPRDPGGATFRGIELREWRLWRKNPTLSAAQMRAELWRSEIGAIAWANYYSPLKCTRMPRGPDVMIADHGFNAGIGASAKVLRRTLGMDAADQIDAFTLLALRGAAVNPGFLEKLRAAQEADYRADRDFPAFGKDWLARLGRCEMLAARLAAAASLAPIGTVPTTGQR